MALLLLAGLNMSVFQLLTFRGVSVWDIGPATPVRAKIAGALSLSIWTGVVICGRTIGFTMSDLGS
jgi:hypothetical protein